MHISISVFQVIVKMNLKGGQAIHLHFKLYRSLSLFHFLFFVSISFESPSLLIVLNDNVSIRTTSKKQLYNKTLLTILRLISVLCNLLQPWFFYQFSKGYVHCTSTLLNLWLICAIFKCHQSTNYAGLLEPLFSLDIKKFS